MDCVVTGHLQMSLAICKCHQPDAAVGSFISSRLGLQLLAEPSKWLAFNQTTSLQALPQGLAGLAVLRA
jgi:hypothetical protein